MSEKATGIVLRVVEFSETSSVVTLWTREFGKIRGLAKGARRPKGPFESALDLLALCQIVFLRKSSDSLDLLTEAKLERRFRAATRDLSRLYAGYYVAELLNELTDDYDALPQLFDLACDTLRRLETDEPMDMVLLRFELLTLHWLGHLPSLINCVECGVEVGGVRVAFGLLDGGVLCRDCRPGRRQVATLGREVINVMGRLADPQACAPPAIELSKSTSGQLRGVLNRYLCNLMGRKPRMHDYLGLVWK